MAADPGASIVRTERQIQDRVMGTSRLALVGALAIVLAIPGFVDSVPGFAECGAGLIATLVAIVLARAGHRGLANALTLAVAAGLPLFDFSVGLSFREMPGYLAPVWALPAMFVIAWLYPTWVGVAFGGGFLAVVSSLPFWSPGAHTPAILNTVILVGTLFAITLHTYRRRHHSLGLIVAQAQELASREARLNGILDTAFDGIAILGDGLVIDCNAAFERLLGLAPTRPPFPLASVVAPSYRDLLPDLQTQACHQTRELDLLTRDGETIPVEVASRPYLEADSKLMVLAIRDLRERRKVEELRLSLLATASHELRTPLTAIHGSICAVTDLMAAELPAEALNLLGMAKRSSSRLVRLLQDLLDAQRLQLGEMTVRRDQVDLGDVVDDAVESLMPLAESGSVEVEVQDHAEGAQVCGDADRLVQVLVNLLGNAVRYSPAGSAIRLEVSANATHAHLSVSDTGPGIPQAFQSRIFQRFSRSDEGDNGATKGSGLGLFISKGIVEAHGGTIGFETAPGKGTTFRFTVPIWKPTEAPSQEGTREEASVSRERHGPSPTAISER